MWDNKAKRTLQKNAILTLFLDKENKYLKRIQKHSVSASIVPNISSPLISHVENIMEIEGENQEQVETISSRIQKHFVSTSIVPNLSSPLTSHVENTMDVEDENQEQMETISSGIQEHSICLNCAKSKFFINFTLR
ncbi:hypothetical protein P5V15_002670 [Pogonomyrmex californicus]